MTEVTDEMRARAKAEAADVLARVMGTYEKPARQPRKSRRRDGGPGRGSNLRERPPKYDRDEAKRLFDDGCTVNEICQVMGAHRSTVSAMLKEKGVDTSKNVGGPKRKSLCGKGLHDMAIFGREVKGGGRYCVKCKSERGKKAWRERHEDVL